MNIICCIDTPERMGMSFNNNRLSRDRQVVKEISHLTRGHCLRMAPQSQELFKDFLEDGWNNGPDVVKISDDFLEMSHSWDYCFVEYLPDEWPNPVYKIILYVWNREYPSDKKFPFDIFNNDMWVVRSKREFPGNSHELISEYVFERATVRSA